MHDESAIAKFSRAMVFDANPMTIPSFLLDRLKSLSTAATLKGLCEVSNEQDSDIVVISTEAFASRLYLPAEVVHGAIQDLNQQKVVKVLRKNINHTDMMTIHVSMQQIANVFFGVKVNSNSRTVKQSTIEKPQVPLETRNQTMPRDREDPMRPLFLQDQPVQQTTNTQVAAQNVPKPSTYGAYIATPIPLNWQPSDRAIEEIRQMVPEATDKYLGECRLKYISHQNARSNPASGEGRDRFFISYVTTDWFSYGGQDRVLRGSSSYRDALDDKTWTNDPSFNPTEMLDSLSQSDSALDKPGNRLK